MRFLTAIPVYNEASHIKSVLSEVRKYSPEILVVNDGSTDETPRLLAAESGLRVIAHPTNRGYGAALISAFDYTLAHDFDVLVTMDCDGQHEPSRIPVLLEALCGVDIVSGSRYLRDFRQDTPAPNDRREINATITREINERYGLDLTDAFCGFKAYRRDALAALDISDTGYAMPLEVWVQAARAGLKIVELPVPLIYLEEARSFGGSLDDANTRIKYYYRVLDRALGGADLLPTAGRRAAAQGEAAG